MRWQDVLSISEDIYSSRLPDAIRENVSSSGKYDPYQKIKLYWRAVADSQNRTRVLEMEHHCRSLQYVWAKEVSCHRLKWISLLADFHIAILSWSVAEVTDGKNKIPALLTWTLTVERKFHVDSSNIASRRAQPTCLAASNVEEVSLRMSS